MDKLYRRTQILELLKAEGVATQAELRRKLVHRGIHVTQATLSRDLEELGVVKTREGYRPSAALKPVAPAQRTLPLVLKEFLREVHHAGNLVVIRTHPGNAHSVAVALDASRWREVCGTVAGDDTIFVATARVQDAARVRKKILSLLAS